MNCNSELVTDFILENKSSSTIIRCGNCGHNWTPFQKQAASDPLAKRSFFFGVGAMLMLLAGFIILLLFSQLASMAWLIGMVSFAVLALGISAVYTGIKSLLRSRFSRIRPLDRRAAVAGITIGTMFGIFGSLCSFAGLGAMLLERATRVEIASPAQWHYAMAGLAEMDLPDELQDFTGKKFFGSTDLRAFDSSDISNRTTRFDLVYYPPIMFNSMTTIDEQLANNFALDLDYRAVKSEPLTWDIMGDQLNVNKIYLEYRPSLDPGQKAVLYISYKTIAQGSYCFSFFMTDPHPTLDEQKVKQFFESIRPVEEVTVDERWYRISAENRKNVANQKSTNEEASNQE